MDSYLGARASCLRGCSWEDLPACAICYCVCTFDALALFLGAMSASWMTRLVASYSIRMAAATDSSIASCSTTLPIVSQSRLSLTPLRIGYTHHPVPRKESAGNGPMRTKFALIYETRSPFIF